MLLSRAGFPTHVIEHTLRWASDAWKGYLREDFQDIDKASSAIFAAAAYTPATLSTPDPTPLDSSPDDGR